MKGNNPATTAGQEIKPGDIGIRIQALRKAAQMTQAELGEAVGVSDRHIRNVESGLCGASVDTLSKLAAFFNVTLDYLVLGKHQLNDVDLKNELHFLIQGLIAFEKKLKAEETQAV